MREILPHVDMGPTFWQGLGLSVTGGSLMGLGVILSGVGGEVGTTSEPIGKDFLIGGVAGLGTGAVLLAVGLVLEAKGRGTHTSGAETLFPLPALTAPTSLLEAPTGSPALVRF